MVKIAITDGEEPEPTSSGNASIPPATKPDTQAVPKKITITSNDDDEAPPPPPKPKKKPAAKKIAVTHDQSEDTPEPEPGPESDVPPVVLDPNEAVQLAKSVDTLAKEAAEIEAAAVNTSEDEQEQPAESPEPSGPPAVADEASEDYDQVVEEAKEDKKVLPGLAPLPIPAPEEEQPTVDGETPSEPAVEAEPKAKAQSEKTSTEYDDPLTDAAVDAIAVQDSDELLERQDIDKMIDEEPEQKSFFGKLLGLPAAWWHHRLLRNTTLLLLFFAILGFALWPNSRYYVLNSAGVRVSSSLQVTDNKTDQPLKNVHVTIGSVSTLTDANGMARLSGLKLGQSKLVVERRAFAPVTKNVVLGWGSNPLGTTALDATGATFTFKVTDWLSGKPLEKAEATSGDASAFSDKQGEVSLVLDAAASDNPAIAISLAGYRSETITNTDTKSITAVRLVTTKQHLFVSKRSGKYDVYKVDIDGKNEAKLVAATGLERDDMVLVPHPGSDMAVLVATRENSRNQDGFLLSGIYLVDVKTGALTKLGQSEKIQVVDWIGDRLVYVMVAQGASGTNPKRHRLISYNVTTGDKKEIAASNYFNDVMSAGGKIFYAPSNSFQEDPKDAKLFMVDPDGKNQQTLLSRESWNIIRTDYSKLAVSVQDEWYEYTLGGSVVTKLPGAPSDVRGKLYVDNKDRTKTLWLDDRDGKGVLVMRDTSTGQDKVLDSRAGIKQPVEWLTNDIVIFRVATGQETADYAISISGGKAVKVRDVSAVAGIDKWYYYQ